LLVTPGAAAAAAAAAGNPETAYFGVL